MGSSLSEERAMGEMNSVVNQFVTKLLPLSLVHVTRKLASKLNPGLSIDYYLGVMYERLKLIESNAPLSLEQLKNSLFGSQIRFGLEASYGDACYKVVKMRQFSMEKVKIKYKSCNEDGSRRMRSRDENAGFLRQMDAEFIGPKSSKDANTEWDFASVKNELPKGFTECFHQAQVSYLPISLELKGANAVFKVLAQKAGRRNYANNCPSKKHAILQAVKLATLARTGGWEDGMVYAKRDTKSEGSQLTGITKRMVLVKISQKQLSALLSVQTVDNHFRTLNDKLPDHIRKAKEIGAKWIRGKTPLHLVDAIDVGLSSSQKHLTAPFVRHVIQSRFPAILPMTAILLEESLVNGQHCSQWPAPKAPPAIHQVIDPSTHRSADGAEDAMEVDDDDMEGVRTDDLGVSSGIAAELSHEILNPATKWLTSYLQCQSSDDLLAEADELIQKGETLAGLLNGVKFVDVMKMTKPMDIRSLVEIVPDDFQAGEANTDSEVPPSIQLPPPRNWVEIVRRVVGPGDRKELKSHDFVSKHGVRVNGPTSSLAYPRQGKTKVAEGETKADLFSLLFASAAFRFLGRCLVSILAGLCTELDVQA
ncbi:hypothetical protein HDV05_008277, partial [Chytridiales sp. JEL 0842]